MPSTLLFVFLALALVTGIAAVTYRASAGLRSRRPCATRRADRAEWQRWIKRP